MLGMGGVLEHTQTSKGGYKSANSMQSENLQSPTLFGSQTLVGGKLLVHAAVCVAHGGKLIVYLYTYTHNPKTHLQCRWTVRQGRPRNKS